MLMTETRWSYRSNPEIPGLLNSGGQPARGRLLKPADDAGRAKIEYVDTCSRCGGAGGAQKWSHTGYTCFDCSGSGRGKLRSETAYTPEAYARLEAARAVRQAKAEAHRQAERARIEAEIAANRERQRAEFEVYHPGLAAEILAHVDDTHPGTDEKTFLAQMAAALEHTGTLSHPQIVASQRILEIERQRREERAGSRYLGEIGDAIEIEAEVVKVIDITRHNDFPVIYRYIVLLKSADGQTLKYIGNSRAIPGKGQTCHLRAKVKAHDEYQGIKQTVIERPRAI